MIVCPRCVTVIVWVYALVMKFVYVAEVCVWLFMSTSSIVRIESSTLTSPPMWSECI